jgi:hypothetical protein
MVLNHDHHHDDKCSTIRYFLAKNSISTIKRYFSFKWERFLNKYLIF